MQNTYRSNEEDTSTIIKISGETGRSFEKEREQK
jgi:hypothetical protein